MRCDALGSPNSFINLTNWRVGEITFYWWPSRGRCAMKAILLLNKKTKITFSQFDIFPLMCSKQVTRISSVYGDVVLFGFYHFLLHLCCCSTAVGEIRNRLVADWNFSFKQGTGPKGKKNSHAAFRTNTQHFNETGYTREKREGEFCKRCVRDTYIGPCSI